MKRRRLSCWSPYHTKPGYLIPARSECAGKGYHCQHFSERLTASAELKKSSIRHDFGVGFLITWSPLPIGAYMNSAGSRLLFVVLRREWVVVALNTCHRRSSDEIEFGPVKSCSVADGRDDQVGLGAMSHTPHLHGHARRADGLLHVWGHFTLARQTCPISVASYASNPTFYSRCAFCIILVNRLVQLSGRVDCWRKSVSSYVQKLGITATQRQT